MLLSVYRGFIHVELLKGREAAEIVRGYRATFEFFRNLGHSPQFQTLDNEKSGALEKFLRNEAKMTVEFVPSLQPSRARH